MNRNSPHPFPQPLDRAVLTLMGVLAILTAILLWSGDHTLPRVQDFSWQNRRVGAEDRAFVLTFNRLMDWQGVSRKLRLQPSLPGKTSWTGRRLAYTLTEPIPYGQTFQLELQGATEATLGRQQQPSKQVQPFSGQFRSRDRAFVYIGINGQEQGRLVLDNLTLGRKTILTPANLAIFDFKPYPEGDRVLFTAATRSGQQQPAFDPELYSVSTGIQVNSPDLAPGPKVSAGQLTRLLDNRDYQIFKFDLAGEGKQIVVQRAPRNNLGQVALWVLPEQGEPRLLTNQVGGDFLVAPDGSTLVMAVGQGLAVLPITPDGNSKSAASQTGQPLDFLPQYGMVMGFARDGSAATMVKFNSDFSRSLFLITNQGQQRELLRLQGSVLSTQFDPQKQFLYCLLTRVLPGQDYNEQPYLAAVNLETGKLIPLLDLKDQRNLRMSLAPDGSGLLFDRSSNPGGTAPIANQLWLLPISQPTPDGGAAQAEPTLSQIASPQIASPQVASPQLVAAGFYGRWLP